MDKDITTLDSFIARMIGMALIVFDEKNHLPHPSLDPRNMVLASGKPPDSLVSYLAEPQPGPSSFHPIVLQPNATAETPPSRQRKRRINPIFPDA